MTILLVAALTSVIAAAQALLIAKQGFFYVGGREVGMTLADAMFVEYALLGIREVTANDSDNTDRTKETS